VCNVSGSGFGVPSLFSGLWFCLSVMSNFTEEYQIVCHRLPTDPRCLLVINSRGILSGEPVLICPHKYLVRKIRGFSASSLRLSNFAGCIGILVIFNTNGYLSVSYLLATILKISV
jgi:hypothetical protein